MSDSQPPVHEDAPAELEANPEEQGGTEPPPAFMAELKPYLHGLRHYGVFTLDARGKIQSWSTSAKDIAGFSEHEVLGRDLDFLHPVEDVEQGRPRQFLAAAEEHGRLEVEGWRLRKGGSRFWAEEALIPVRDKEGRLSGFAVLICDISSLRDAADERRRLSAIVEATPDLIIFGDLDGRVLYANRAARRLMKETPDNPVVGQVIFRYQPTWAASLLLHEGFPTALRKGSWRGETAFLGPGGQEVPTSQVLLSHASTGGEVDSFSTVARDISDQRRTEDILRCLVEASRVLSMSLRGDMVLESACRLPLPLEADWCNIYLLENGELVHAAAAHVDPVRQARVSELRGRRFPLQPDAPVGRHRVVQTRVPELVPEVTDAWLYAALPPEEARLYAERELDASSIIILPLVARGTTLGAMTVGLQKTSPRRYDARALALFEDLSGRIAMALDNARLYQQAEQAYEQTQQAVRAREKLLAVVSHDLRTPLNTIALAASALLNTELSEETQAWVRERLEVVMRSTKQMSRLIQDLLDVTQLEAGRMSLEPTPFDLAAFLREACENFQPLAQDKQIKLACEAPPELPTVVADRYRILQVLSNLVFNAIKFTPEAGQVVVRAEPLSGEVRLSVADTGPGISGEQLPHLFEPFWQAQRADHRGAGLGLAIARQILAAHGQRLWVESHQGAGSTFFFTLATVDPTKLH